MLTFESTPQKRSLLVSSYDTSYVSVVVIYTMTTNLPLLYRIVWFGWHWGLGRSIMASPPPFGKSIFYWHLYLSFPTNKCLQIEERLAQLDIQHQHSVRELQRIR